MSFVLLHLVFLGLAGPWAYSQALTERTGTLRLGDETLTSGEFKDAYSIQARSGEWIEVALTSSEFDPYLILRPPGCSTETCTNQVDNDDFLVGGGAFAWHQVSTGEGGAWEILATSSEPGERGAYEVRYRVVADGGEPATPGVRLEDQSQRGRLELGDKTLTSGEFVDNVGFVGRQGETVEINLTSSDFDPYLILFMPEPHAQIDNDDYEDSTSRAFIRATLPAHGLYRIAVTSYQPGESGGYRLEVAVGAQVDPFVKKR
ncbi:MAG: hypothetical protein HKN04_04675 [Rhodothermaceae bacterium]|nr:hypothetical protein [Rhodothermaceae bacterium]